MIRIMIQIKKVFNQVIKNKITKQNQVKKTKIIKL